MGFGGYAFATSFSIMEVLLDGLLMRFSTAQILFGDSAVVLPPAVDDGPVVTGVSGLVLFGHAIEFVI